MMGRHIFLVFCFAHKLHALKPSEAPDTTGLVTSPTQDNMIKRSGSSSSTRTSTIKLSANSKTNWCDDFDWKGKEIKVVDDCELLKDNITVKLLMITHKSECINFADLSIQEEWMNTWHNVKGGKNRIIHFENTLKDQDSITSNSRVDVTFRVTLLGNGFDTKYFTTQFSLDTRNCSTTDRTLNSRGRKNHKIAIGVGSTTVGLLLIVALGCCLKKKRDQEKNAKPTPTDTDENPIYGTYSRGLDGEGDYGDGDKVYVTDTNDYYAVR